MLTPEQLAGLPDEVVALFRDLEEFVIGDIARRIGKAMDMTATADGQIAIARAAGFDMRDVEARIRKTAELAEERVAEVMEKAAQVSVQAENVLYSLAGKGTANILSPALSALLHEGIAQTQGELRNLTQSLGFAEKGKDGVRRWLPAAQMYQTELDRALARVRSGACDRRTAVRSAVENLAKSGLSPKVTFETGHKDKLDVAVARAVRTGTNQMAARMTEHVMGELGAEYVETSAHPGARPSHAAWQGKVFHVGGDVDGYPDFESSTGYGDVAGLCGANCRHSFAPFFPGIMARTWTDESLEGIDPPPFEYRDRSWTHYEATQEQRRIEREMRETKRKIAGFEASGEASAMDLQNMRIKLQMQRREYEAFSQKAGLPYQLDRTQVRGFGRAEAQRAVWAQRNFHRDWLKSIGAESTSLDTVAKYRMAKYNNTREYQLLDGYETCISKGELSPLTGFEFFVKISEEAEQALIGLQAADGTTIERIHSHFVARVIGAYERQGVPIADIKDALLAPIAMKSRTVKGDRRIAFVGEGCSVAISIDDRLVIQTNPRKKKKKE